MGKKQPIRKNIHCIDILTYGICIIICFLLFSHSDLLVTAQNSTVYLQGNWKDFYTGCYELGGNYNANYLPSTFFVFAIWNLPLKFLGMLPSYWGDWNNIFFLWNKLLPVTAFFLSAYIIYKICKEEFDFDDLRAKLAVIIFLTSPVIIYCQFIFSQYDIFTVFFMLVGMYYYFKKDRKEKHEYLFILFFGIAATFKYFALVYFFVFLMLKDKKIITILKKGVAVIVPILMSGGIYFVLDRQSFNESVLKFNALSNAQGQGINIGLTTVNLAVIAICVILAWVYFTETEDYQNQVKFSLYFSCGISFAIFSFLHWHPQWLVLAVPFWSMAFVFNDKTDVFVWIDLLFGVVFNVLIVNEYAQICDENVLRYGILSSIFRYRELASTSMSEIYIFKDKSILYAIIVAIFIIYFVFNHPKRMNDKIEKNYKDIYQVVRVRFLIYVLCFIGPVLISAKSLLNTSEKLWEIPISTEWLAYGDTQLEENIITQSALLPKGKVDSVCVYTATNGHKIEASYIELEIYNEESGQVIARGRINPENIRDCSEAEFTFENLEIPDSKRYVFVYRIKSFSDEPVLMLARKDTYKNIYQLNSKNHNYSNDSFVVNEIEQNNNHLIMSVNGYLYK